MVQTEQEKAAQVKMIWDNFVKYFFQKYEDSNYNARLLGAYIDKALGGEVSLDNLQKALNNRSVECHLHIKTTQMNAAEIAAKPAEENRLAEEKRQIDIVNFWLRQHCPTGLKSSTGEPYAADIDRIIEFIRRNHGGKVTLEALNDAVTTLENVLTWFDRSPAATAIRNPAPLPPRKLSERALIESGQKSDPSTRRNHANDGKVKSVAEVAKEVSEILRKKTGLPTEEEHWKNKLEGISVTNSMGRYDHVKSAELKQVRVWNPDGSPNYRKSFELADKLADAVERLKNRRAVD